MPVTSAFFIRAAMVEKRLPETPPESGIPLLRWIRWGATRIGAMTDISRRCRREVAPLVLLAVAAALLMTAVGWNQASRYAQVRSLVDNQRNIDRDRWTTNDFGFSRGHYYPDKAPGVALLETPVYEALRLVHFPQLLRDSSMPADQLRFWPAAAVPRGVARPATDREIIGVVWVMGLVASVAAGLAVMLLIRSKVEELAPAYGTFAALVAGAGTMLFSFSTVLFGHVLAAALGFGAFAALWRGPRVASLRTAAIGGLLAGAAITTDYTLAILAAILGLYVIASTRSAGRTAIFALGVGAGVLPLLLYTWWLFGSPFHATYGDVAANHAGLFGFARPHLKVAIALLFSDRGLVTLSPVLLLAAPGCVAMYRRGLRAEAAVIAATAAAFLAFNSGYNTPFGGSSPGPRFLMPVIPFLAVAVGVAASRLRASALILGSVSVLYWVLATSTTAFTDETYSPGAWAGRLVHARFTPTVLTALGLGDGWLAIAPFFVTALAAIWFAARSSRRAFAAPSDGLLAAALLGSWILVLKTGLDLMPAEQQSVTKATEAGILLFAAAVAALAIRIDRGSPLAAVAAAPLAILIVPGVTALAVMGAAGASLVLSAVLALGAGLNFSRLAPAPATPQD
jgi:hypothetical protein